MNPRTLGQSTSSPPFRSGASPTAIAKQYADFSRHRWFFQQYSTQLWSMDTTVSPMFASEGLGQMDTLDLFF